MSGRAVEREVRFAVVMYGGVSLAIYMNGISQELFALVRATRKGDEPPADDGTSSEGVYARIARELTRRANEPVRFVIDILSGTSAGGINAVCLAKALATGSAGLEALETTWLENGNIDTLLNDAESELRLYPSAVPKTSLFNSERMSAKLLEAFRKMDEQLGPDRPVHALADELDLFVTATDLRGLEAPIMTFDRSIDERIHKQVFHFEKRAGDPTAGDFTTACNPMLAFASRCTSSFPAAFEPMTLELLEACRRRERDQSLPPGFQLRQWGKFFAPYLPNASEASFASKLEALQLIEFADGGYLDNRPFGYATAAIATRYATGPVERRLFFIDPWPETATHREGGSHGRPRRPEPISFARNVELALTTLPRYETIRGDIEAIEERNRWYLRVRGIMDGVDTVLRQATDVVRKERKQADRESSREYRRRFGDESLAAAVKVYGPAYAPYHRAKVAALTDELALMITRAAGLDQRAEFKRAIAALVSAWRERRFVADPAGDGVQVSENQFLMRYDLGFRLRRLNFLRSRIERMLSKGRLEVLMLPLSGENASEPQTRRLVQAELDELRRLHRVVAHGIVELYELRRRLLALGEENPIQPLLEGLLRDGFADELVPLVAGSRPLLARKVPDLITRFERHLDAIADKVSGFVKDGAQRRLGTWQIAEQVANALPSDGAPELSELRSGLRRLYYEQFDLRDSMVYPFLSGEDYGEGSPIDVLRISPIDASRALWSMDSQPTKNKLAGESLGGFAAFFDRNFRKNDILWGRLDGAERIIHALLPGDESDLASLREVSIREAHRRIVRQYLTAWIAEGIASTSLRATLEEALKTVPAAESQSPAWQADFQRVYARVDTVLRLDAKAFERLGRSSRIVSSMVNVLGRTRHAGWWSFVSVCIRTLSPCVLGLARAISFFQTRHTKPAPAPPIDRAPTALIAPAASSTPVDRRATSGDPSRHDSTAV